MCRINVLQECYRWFTGLLPFCGFVWNFPDLECMFGELLVEICVHFIGMNNILAYMSEQSDG